ncbi:hypothetical protein [Nevskia sp.]|uniref:hypothetical protein n=1 Tax=Nevskia sp. TaxID=1929292 RepID=UPI0025D9E4B7|nr:hypothetical protein [Nevskia sp.]
MTGMGVAAAEVDYDRTGRWPVTADGWQIRALGHSLFPGGPGACEVISPLGRFYFGLDFEAPGNQTDRQLALVTQLGRATLKATNRNLLTAPEAVAKARQQVSAYLLHNAPSFHYLPIHAVEFRTGDGKIVDIF